MKTIYITLIYCSLAFLTACGTALAETIITGTTADGNTDTWNQSANMTHYFTVASTFSGGLVAGGSVNWRIEANADDCLGTGDVTINNTVTLIVQAPDTIDDSATLYLNGGRDTKLATTYQKLHLTSSETVYSLVINGNPLPAATYGATGSGADYELPLISGSGILTTLAGTDLPLVGGELGVMTSLANYGINPATGEIWQKGDQYRLLFVTTGTTNATATDIGAYNTFVQGIAATSTNYPLLGSTTWNVIGSTLTVDARDNTEMNPTTNDTDVAIIALDGLTMISANNANLWANSLSGAPKFDQHGVAQTYGNVATGTEKYADGTKELVQHLGASPKICYGRCTETGGNWMEVYNGAASGNYPYYAVSIPLTVVSTAPKGTLLLAR